MVGLFAAAPGGRGELFAAPDLHDREPERPAALAVRDAGGDVVHPRPPAHRGAVAERGAVEEDVARDPARVGADERIELARPALLVVARGEGALQARAARLDVVRAESGHVVADAHHSARAR